MNQGKGPANRHLSLTVESTSGDFTDEFNRNNRAQKILDEAIKRFRLNPAGVYLLSRASDERRLALDQKLEELGLEDGDVVIVQANQAQDG
jgi:uncharacterized membrane protein YdfJ with MMPL/SSD domain